MDSFIRSASSEAEISSFYANLLFAPLKRGESVIFAWFPGGGKTTTIDNILSSKALLKEVLGNLFLNLKIASVKCSQTENGSLPEIVVALGLSLGVDVSGSTELMSECRRLSDSGQELVIIVDRIEDISDKDAEKLLGLLGQLVAINKSRIHTLINCLDKSKLENTLISNALTLALAQNVGYAPLLSGKMLERYVDEYANYCGVSLSASQKKAVLASSAGLLLITREIIRNGGGDGQSELKFRSIWQRTPLLYQQVLKKLVREEKIRGEIELRAKGELEQLAVLDQLQIFKDHYRILEDRPLEFLAKALTAKEKKIFSFLQVNKGKLVSKDKIADLIWGKSAVEKYSAWAIDQTISRLKKKLLKAGFEEDSLETVKGRGYKWLLPN